MVVFKVMNFKSSLGNHKRLPLPDSTRGNPLWLPFIYLLFFSGLAIAEEASFGGHIKYQFAATHYQNDHLYARYGSQSQYDHFLDFRLTADNRWGHGMLKFIIKF